MSTQPWHYAPPSVRARHSFDALTAAIAIAHLRLRLDILTRYPHLLRDIMAEKPKTKNHLPSIAGIMQALHDEQVQEAEALVTRMRKNHTGVLGMIAEGHKREKAKEDQVAQAEEFQKEMEAVVGDNGGPSLDDEAALQKMKKARADLDAAKADSESSSDASKKSQGQGGEADKHPQASWSGQQTR